MNRNQSKISIILCLIVCIIYIGYHLIYDSSNILNIQSNKKELEDKRNELQELLIEKSKKYKKVDKLKNNIDYDLLDEMLKKKLGKSNSNELIIENE